jgi:redox-sensitive bicupin YhaK (pirin superfamily)
MAAPDVRQIRRVQKSQPTMEGAGVHLRRVFGFHGVEEYDPFLLLDDFRSDTPEEYLPGFPWHPHRGIETITYMLDGSVEHGDSIGNSGVIGPGGVQWMTAGNGIVHQEMPKGDPDGRMGGFQLWANLPAASKMIDPRYQEFTDLQIPTAKLPGGGSAKVVCGEIAGTRGPVENVVIEPGYFDITLPAHTTFDHPTPVGHTVIAYIVDGAAYFDERHDPYAFEAEGEGWSDTERECLQGNHTLVLFEDGGSVKVSTADQPVRFLLITGKPLHEPVAWYGPIVMNTQEELRTAFQELQEGTFLKVDRG